MKRLTAIVVSGVLAAGVIVACGGSDPRAEQSVEMFPSLLVASAPADWKATADSVSMTLGASALGKATPTTWTREFVLQASVDTSVVADWFRTQAVKDGFEVREVLDTGTVTGSNADATRFIGTVSDRSIRIKVSE